MYLKVKIDLCCLYIYTDPHGCKPNNTLIFLAITKKTCTLFASLQQRSAIGMERPTVFCCRRRADSGETKESIKYYGNGNTNRAGSYIGYHQYCEQLNRHCLPRFQLFIFVLVMDSTSFLCDSEPISVGHIAQGVELLQKKCGRQL
jgi:hypothetical protein